MKLDTLKVETKDRVTVVSLNRPEMRNAFHPVMIRELTDVFAQLATRIDISAVVLKGEGKGFCSGADLGYMQSMAGYSLAENLKDSEQLFGMFWALRSCPHPIVGRLHGHVMGGALGLASLCDVAAAVEGTQFCFSEVKLGLVPAVISPFVLEKMQSPAAKRFMLTAEVFGVQDAFESGLIQKFGSEVEVDQFVASLLKSLCQNGPEATRVTKALLRTLSGELNWEVRRALTTQAIAERRVSEEGQEGLRGFLEKRRPKWKPAE